MSKLQKIVLAIISLVLIAVTVGAIMVPKEETLATKNFTKPPFDSSAIDGPPNGIPDEYRFKKAELKQNLIIGICSNLVVKDTNDVELYLTSYSDNIGYIRVVLYDKDNNQLGSTGLVKPNQYVKSIKLDSVPNENSVIVAKVLTYDESNYYSLGSVNIKLNLSK